MFGHSLRNLPVLLVLLASPLPAQPYSDEEPGATVMPPGNQEYFLVQAFSARDAARRRSMYHVGLLAEPYDGGYVVGAVLDGFPAQRAGLRRGDRLLAIDGEPFHPVLSFNPQIGDGQSPPVSRQERRLEYSRNDAVATVALSPVFGNLYDAYRTASLNSPRQIPNGNKVIGYLKLWSLDRSTDGIIAFRRLIESLDHCDGLVLDLRDGYGFAGAGHLDAFFASRSTFPVIQGASQSLWPDRPPPRLNTEYYDRPMVVIQNGGTSAGMELFAYQLAKLERVISVGERTGGRMGLFSLDDSGNPTYQPAPDLRLDGIEVGGQGIAPEREIPYPASQSLPTDPQLDGAMLTLMSIL